jgi:hypothetical protein
MKTIEIKLYQFSELSESAKQKAIENYRNDNTNEDYSYLYGEAHESVKAFHNVFGTNEGNRSWSTCRFDHIDDNILELTGLRLRKYLIK